MKNFVAILLVTSVVMFSAPAGAKTPSARVAASEGEHVGQWIASGGLGLTISPTLFLINPQLEYAYHHNLYFGPMVQAAFSDGSLVTMGGTVRYLVDSHLRLKPSLEGGFGMAVGSSAFGSSSVGVHFSFGMGFDYVIDGSLRIGTMIRANLAPPLKTFFLSWPLLMVRCYL